jgi:hypothetical protein
MQVKIQVTLVIRAFSPRFYFSITWSINILSTAKSLKPESNVLQAYLGVGY